MANKKITELNEATSISGTDWLVMVDVANDETKKIHANQVGGNIPIQDTAPQNPEEDDLWIDTSEPEELSARIVNEASNSTTDTYSCNYVNKIGKPVAFFGDVAGDTNNTYHVQCFAKVRATKISADGIWRFDIQGKFERDANVSANYFTWGFMPSKLSALLNNAIGVQVEYDSSLLSNSYYQVYKTTGEYDVNHNGYGTVFEWVDNNYLLFSRYYNTAGNAGGWTLDSFATGQAITATICLREV